MSLQQVFNFRCHIIKKVFLNIENFYGIYRFTTKKELPHTIRLNKNYNDIKNEHDTTKVWQGTINGTCGELKINQQYEIEAKLTNSRKGDQIYYNYTVQKISPLITNIEDKVKFIQAICTKRQAEEIIKSCPNFLDMVIDGQDIPKIKYIGEKSLSKIKRTIHDNYWLNDILVWLSPLGITNKMIHKLFEGEKNFKVLKQRITDNPYLLTKIRGLGFKKVDGLALKINPSIVTSQFRYDAFVMWFFTDIANSRGDTLITIDEFDKGKRKYIPEFYPQEKEIVC